VTAQAVLVYVPDSVVVAAVLVVEDLGAQVRSAPVVASVVPLAEVLVYVPRSVAVAVLVVEDLGARLRSGAAVAASVAPLADALSEVTVAPAVASCASVAHVELAVAVAAFPSAPVVVLAFPPVLPGLAPVVDLLRQHAQRSAVQSELASAAAARVVAFAGEHLCYLELPRRRAWSFAAACVLRLFLVQPYLMFEVLPPVAHPGSGAFGSWLFPEQVPHA
jgi:hypothetical protein